MTVSRNEIDHIARLAALAVDDGTMAELTKQIGDILDYVAQLEKVPLDEATAEHRAGPTHLVLRDDVVDPIKLTLPVGELAPEFEEGFFIVPKVAGLGDDE